MNIRINPQSHFTANKKSNAPPKDIPFTNTPLTANYMKVKDPIEEGFTQIGENIAQGIADTITTQKTKWQKAKIAKKVKVLNSNLAELSAQQNIFTENQLLNNINQAFQKVRLKITPMNFKDVTKEELLKFLKYYIEYYSVNGKDALIKASLEQTQAENMRSNVINDIITSLKKGAASYTTPTIRELLTTSLNPLNLNKNLENSEQYIEGIKNVYKIHLENSEKINNLLEAFRDLSKNYFTKTSSKLEEIMNLKQESLYKYLERIPKVGIIPKGFRVKEQHEMIKAMLLDYADATECYIKNGADPIIVQYSKQHKDFTEYLNSIIPEFKHEENIQAIRNMIENINKTNKNRNTVYNNLLKIYIGKGSKLKTACKQIKTKGKIELGAKLITTLTTLY